MQKYFYHSLLITLAAINYPQIELCAMEQGLIVELPIAARKKMIPELKQLLESGIDVNTRTKDGYTALHWAANNGHRQAVALLLTYNAQVDAETPNGQKAWQLAEDNGHDKIVKVLKAHAKLLKALAEADSDDSDEPVSNHPGITLSKSMDKIKPQPSAPPAERSSGEQQVTEIEECVICCDVLHDPAKKVVRISANCNHLLHSTCRSDLMRNNNVNKVCPICRRSITGFINEDLQEPKKVSTAPAAVSRKTMEPGAPPLEEEERYQGGDINASDHYGRTPLHWAAISGLKELAKSLLVKGAFKEARDNEGNTPLHLASEKGYMEVVELLLGNGLDIMAVAHDGSTPLHVAAMNGYRKVVELLLANGADIEAVTNVGSTPLHCASKKGHREVVGFLIIQGANACAEDKNGNTPWQCTSNKDIYSLLKKASEQQKMDTSKASKKTSTFKLVFDPRIKRSESMDKLKPQPSAPQDGGLMEAKKVSSAPAAVSRKTAA